MLRYLCNIPSLTTFVPTRLRLSQLFDSSAAVKRLVEPEMKDHERLIKSPKPPTLLTQCWFDPELRLLGFSVLAVAVIGALMAAY